MFPHIRGYAHSSFTQKMAAYSQAPRQKVDTPEVRLRKTTAGAPAGVSCRAETPRFLCRNQSAKPIVGSTSLQHPKMATKCTLSHQPPARHHTPNANKIHYRLDSEFLLLSLPDYFFCSASVTAVLCDAQDMKRAPPLWHDICKTKVPPPARV